MKGKGIEMRIQIKVKTEQGEQRVIYLADEVHNQGVSLYADEVEIYYAKTSAEFLEECSEALVLSPSDVEVIRSFRTGLEEDGE